MMSVEKCLALYLPFKSGNICTVKTAKWASGIACVFFFVINFFWFFLVKELKGDAGARYEACVFEDFFVKYVMVHSKIDSVLYCFAPFAVMGLTNIAIIYKFVGAKLASKRDGTESTNQALSNAALRGTAILITVTLTFIILTGPTYIINLTRLTYDTHPLLTPFMYISVSLNHSINGLLYTIVGTKFRKELIGTLCSNRKQALDTESGKSSSTQISTVDRDKNTLPQQ